MEQTLDIGREIITELKMKDIELDGGFRNFIILKVAESYNLGVEEGIKQGMDITCKAFEEKLGSIKDKIYLRKEE